MAETSIEWADFSFNPWRGCRKVSPACKNCYAETRGKRFGEDFSGQRIVLSDAGWKNPIKWNREAEADGVRRKVFCASLADVFEDWGGPMVDHQGGRLAKDTVNGGFISTDLMIGRDIATMNDVRRRLFELIDATPNLDWLLLTKRPENVRKMWCQHTAENASDLTHRQNVFIGTTVENQEQAEKRIPELLKCRYLSPCLFLSCEPLLGPVDLQERLPNEYASPSSPPPSIDWLIAGGESGSNARPSHPDWFRSLRDQCDAAGVPFHFKQWGEWAPGSGGGFTQWPENDKSRLLLMGASLGKKRIDNHAVLKRVGKKKAGRLLDGVEHNGTPEVTL